MGAFVPTESADVQVKATLDGRYHAFGDELSDDPYLLWGADNLLDAKVACEEWLEEKIRTYFPAARALGLLEPSEEEIADAARALKENGVNLSTMDRSALERRVLELYARFRKEEQSK